MSDMGCSKNLALTVSDRLQLGPPLYIRKVLFLDPSILFPKGSPMLDASRISRRIKFRQLNVFIAAVQCGSMAKAAGQLAISQPVISKMIAELEQTLGLPLLERSRLGVGPTLYCTALLAWHIGFSNVLRSSVEKLQSL